MLFDQMNVAQVICDQRAIDQMIFDHMNIAQINFAHIFIARMILDHLKNSANEFRSFPNGSSDI